MSSSRPPSSPSTDARFENVDLRLRTDDNHVGLYGLTAVFAGGQLVSDFTIAHGVNYPPIDGTLKLTNASTTHISTMFDLPGDVRGPLNIEIEADSDITDSSQSLKDVTGHADVVLQNGYVGSDVLRKADSFVNLLAPWRNKKDPSQVNCLVLRYDLADGRATSEVTLLDTTTMTVAGTGYVDMMDETFSLRLVPTPKDANLLSLATAVRITGPIDDPSISAGPLDIATGAADTLLGTLLSPVKMLLPIPGLGDDDDKVCQAALDPNRGASTAASPGAPAPSPGQTAAIRVLAGTNRTGCSVDPEQIPTSVDRRQNEYLTGVDQMRVGDLPLIGFEDLGVMDARAIGVAGDGPQVVARLNDDKGLGACRELQ